MSDRTAQLAGLAARAAAQRTPAEERLVTGVKTCTRCRRVLELAQFSRRTGRLDGRNSVCLQCNRDPAAAHMAALRALRRSRPLPGWVTKCCDAQLLDDPRVSWWLIVDKPDCGGSWQPNLGNGGGIPDLTEASSRVA